MHSLAADRHGARQLAQELCYVPARSVWLSTSGMVIAILLACSPKEAPLRFCDCGVRADRVGSDLRLHRAIAC